MSAFNYVKEKFGNGIEKQLSGNNGSNLVLAVILTGGLIFGLKTIAETIAPQLNSRNTDIDSNTDTDSAVDNSDVDSI